MKTCDIDCSANTNTPRGVRASAFCHTRTNRRPRLHPFSGQPSMADCRHCVVFGGGASSVLLKSAAAMATITPAVALIQRLCAAALSPDTAEAKRQRRVRLAKNKLIQLDSTQCLCFPGAEDGSLPPERGVKCPPCTVQTRQWSTQLLLFIVSA